MAGWRTRGAAALVAGACVLGIAACGSEGDDAGAGAAPPSFFGIMTQDTLGDSDFARMQEGGIGVFRALFPWTTIEPTEGEIDFSSLDPLVAAAAKHGIEVFPYLFGSPEWVAQLDGRSCSDDCVLYAPDTDRSLAAWREFAAAAVERYGPDGEFWRENPDLPELPIHSWQIWNEQNSPSFYAPRPDVDSYERLVATAEQAIHAKDPNAEIVLGGMFDTPLGGDPPAIAARPFLAELYRIEGSDPSFDAVAVHPYSARVSGVRDQVESLHDEAEHAGDDARLWVTEVGWSSGNGAEPLERGPAGQAESLTEAFDYLLANRDRLNLQGVIWYSWRDHKGAGICAWCARSGLFEEDGTTPKPAWSAFTGFTGGS